MNRSAGRQLFPWDVKCLSTGGRFYLYESHQISEEEEILAFYLLSPQRVHAHGELDQISL